MNTKQIIETALKIGEEKITSVKNFKELEALFKAKGLCVTTAEINRAFFEYAHPKLKQEITEDELQEVAGGFGLWIPSVVYKIGQKLFGGGSKKSGGVTGEWGSGASGGWDSGADGSWEESSNPTPSDPTGDTTPGYHQNNGNNSGNQVATQEGDISVGNLGM